VPVKTYREKDRNGRALTISKTRYRLVQPRTGKKILAKYTHTKIKKTDPVFGLFW
jgi:hypothetical protein